MLLWSNDGFMDRQRCKRETCVKMHEWIFQYRTNLRMKGLENGKTLQESNQYPRCTSVAPDGEM